MAIIRCSFNKEHDDDDDDDDDAHEKLFAGMHQ